MYLFFKLIKRLKELDISKEQWNQLADIFASLQDKSFTAFNKAYLAQHAPTGDIAEFIRDWFSMINELKECNTHIVKLSAKSLTDDDRIVIFTALLPADVELLKLAAHKIELLSRISMKHEETNNLLRHLLCAVSSRVKQLQGEPFTPRESSLDAERLQIVISEVYYYILLLKLKQLCIDYRNSVAENLAKYIRKNDEIAYAFYKDYFMAHRFNDFVQEEIGAIKFKCPRVNITTIVELLITKYQHINDLLNTLSNAEKTTSHKLAHFAEKFAAYLDILKTTIEDGTSSLFKTTSYTDTLLESDIIQNCIAVCEKISGVKYSYTNT